MKKVVIFGAGTLARIVYVYLSKDTNYEVAAFTVNIEYLGEGKLLGLDVVPYERIEETYPPDRFSMLVAIGYKRVNKARAEVYEKCKSKGYEMINSISSQTIHWDYVDIGDNCFIRENTVIQPFAKIGNDVIMGSACLIGHDAIIGDHCYISNHATVCGAMPNLVGYFRIIFVF